MQNSTSCHTPSPKEETLRFLRTFARTYVPEEYAGKSCNSFPLQHIPHCDLPN